jgi:hypothetical protein
LTSWTRFVKWFFKFDLLNSNYLSQTFQILFWLIFERFSFVCAKNPSN